MIVLFTDYGFDSPYKGQIEVIIERYSPDVRVISLLSDAPRYNPKASAYLLAAYKQHLPLGTIVFCGIDPDGLSQYKPVIMRCDGIFYIGTDNGVFDIVAKQATDVSCSEILWRPEDISTSFLGRDIYAPVCAMLANGKDVLSKKFISHSRNQWPGDLFEVIYIDHFGNCITGMNAENFSTDSVLVVNGISVKYAENFSSVEANDALWYKNENGLIELAINKGNLSTLCSVNIGMKISNE